MTRQSAARRAKRVLKAAGVAVYARDYLDPRHVNAETLTASFERALELVEKEGGDLTGRLRVDIGAHPNFPGRTTVEVKADRRVSSDPRRLAVIDEIDPDEHSGDCSDPRCPLDHSLDGSGDD